MIQATIRGASMPRPDRPMPVQEFKKAEERFLELLAERGFRVVQRGVRIPVDGLRHGPQFDFLAARGEQLFAVEVKAAQDWADWLFHWLARPILMLQAVHRLRGWEPLLCLHVRHPDPKAAQRFRYQAKLYAPGVWWILADGQGRVVSHLPGEDEKEIEGSADGRQMPDWNQHGHVAASVRAPAARRGPPKLSFGGLDQWLIKVFLLGPSSANWWGGPRGPIGSLLQLAKLAQVSPPLVYRWAAAMEASGYLHQRKARRPPALRSADRLLDEWKGRYRLSHNELIFCKPAFAQQVDESYLKEFLDHLRRGGRLAQGYALSGHQACRFYRVRHSLARSVHLYVAEEPAAFMEGLHLALDPDPGAPIVLVRPKYQRAVFRAAARVEGIVVCDALQVYLDLYHLLDRGREQADFLHDNILKPLLWSSTEQPREL